MSCSPIRSLYLAASFCMATVILLGEAALPAANADQPKGKADQGKIRRPRPANDAPPKKEPKPVVHDANLLSMELKALRILRGLEATPHQLSEIARTAKATAGKPGKREAAKASDAYVEALVQMRHALVANDEEKVEKLRTQFDELEQKNPPDLDDEVEITDGAEIEAVRLLSIFSPQQIVAYAQSLEDDFPNPVQLVLEGLDEGRSLKKEEWETARNKIAEEVGWLVCGTQGEKSKKLEEQVSKFLDQKHAEEGNAGKPEAEVRTLVGSPGPIVVLKNVMEHTLAELLSNPQVERATRDCMRPAPRAASDKGHEAVGDKPVEPLPNKPRNNGQRPRRPDSKTAESTAKRVDLDDVLKSPEAYEGQELRFERVTVTGTAPARIPANLWLAVKAGSGTVVRAGLRGQKLTFVIAKANTPTEIKDMKSDEGDGIPATLVCTIRHDQQTKHWNARVWSIEMHGSK